MWDRCGSPGSAVALFSGIKAPAWASPCWPFCSLQSFQKEIAWLRAQHWGGPLNWWDKIIRKWIHLKKMLINMTNIHSEITYQCQRVTKTSVLLRFSHSFTHSTNIYRIPTCARCYFRLWECNSEQNNYIQVGITFKWEKTDEKQTDSYIICCRVIKSHEEKISMVRDWMMKRQTMGCLVHVVCPGKAFVLR